MHVRLIELEKSQLAESMLGCIRRRDHEFLIIFDENIMDDPLWVPQADWEYLLSLRQDIKLKNFTYYDICGANNRNARIPLMAQELDFSAVLSDDTD